MSAKPIEKVVIVGGGTAGWMTAAALSRLSANGKTQIHLVESDAIGAVGVGEATIPPIAQFNALLGVDENDFLRSCQATFKLGIEFRNWTSDDHAYMHPFGGYGRDIEGVRFYQLWLRAKAMGDISPLGAFSLTEQAAYGAKFFQPSRDPRDVLSALAYAYHFDAGLYAQYLRRYAEARGVRRTEGQITAVHQDPSSGHVTSIRLASGEEIDGELFIDCSGFRGLLIEETLRAGYEDWSHWLPCDRAVAVACERMGDPLPYTRATARNAGWQWRIPLQHRTGNGHVYCSAYTSDDEAAQVLLDNLDAPPTTTPRLIKFTTGRRRDMWSKNVVAIGLSSGFLEPLESTSIHLIQSAIHKLLALFPDQEFAAIERAEFNRLMALQFEQVRDFLILHYHRTTRSGAFWKYVQSMDIPPTLQRRIDLFASKGRIFRHQDELFDEDNWLAVFWGQGVEPRGYDPLADTIDIAKVRKMLTNMNTAIATTTQQMPPHAMYIDRFCRAANPAKETAQ